jgi:hypothetical protein
VYFNIIKIPRVFEISHGFAGFLGGSYRTRTRDTRPRDTAGLCDTVSHTTNGKLIPAMGRLFAILVSTAWHTIWNIRKHKVLKNPRRNITDIELHNRWLKSENSALGPDRILTNKMKFGNLALNKDLVLRTWSGLLMNEDALPDDWTYTVGVLVGIQPSTLNDPRNGIG